MLSSAPGSEVHSGADTPQRRSVAQPKVQQQVEAINNSDSTTETPKRSEESTSTTATSVLDIDVPPDTNQKQPEYYQETWHNDSQRGRASPQVDTSRTRRLFGHRRDPPASSNTATEERWETPQRESVKPEKGELSPPWTGKDSAYSSVSGASAMSPTMTTSRSASAMSSHTAQFGLFPSRNLSTPKGSISGRLGATSPTMSQSSRSTKISETLSRPPTSMSTFSETSSKRLSKRSSFSTLRRLFTKKKSGEIGTIVE